MLNIINYGNANQNHSGGTSFVVQWLDSWAPSAGGQVQFLVKELDLIWYS